MTPGLELAQAVGSAATGLAFTRGCSRSRSPCLAGGDRGRARVADRGLGDEYDHRLRDRGLPQARVVERG